MNLNQSQDIVKAIAEARAAEKPIEMTDQVDELDFMLDMVERPVKWTPQDIANTLHSFYGIRGQEEAVKQASLILYNHFEGRPSVSLFVGPTGCGKTEIWRAISKEMGGQAVLILDGSAIQAEGWHGGLKLSSVFKSIAPDRLKRLIVVIDEIDKLLRPKFGRGNTNYSDIVQDNLLKMCDHDVLTFENEGTTFQVDCKEISVVMLGAFDPIRRSKAAAAQRRSIGFGSVSRVNDEEESKSCISIDDIIRFGMKGELAGRIGSRVINMEPLQFKDLEAIGYQYVRDLSTTVHSRTDIDFETMKILVQEAIDKGLGARYLKSRIDQLLDELIWKDPYGFSGYFLELPEKKENKNEY